MLYKKGGHHCPPFRIALTMPAIISLNVIPPNFEDNYLNKLFHRTLKIIISICILM